MLLSLLISESILGQTRYWVGDGGNWDDPSHWSLTSGGTGGAGMPTASDDAIFDFSSFGGPSTVTLPVGTFECNNLDYSQIAGPITFEGMDINDAKLHVFGSYVGSSWLNNTFNWRLELKGNLACNIETMGATLPNMTIEGINKDVNVIGDMSCQYLSLNGCQLDLNENNLTVSDFIFVRYIVDSVYIDMSSSTVSCAKWDVDDYNQEDGIINIDHTDGELICGTLLPGRYIDYNNVTIDGNLTNTYEETELGLKTWSNNNQDCTFNNISLINSTEFLVDGSLEINNNLKIESGSTLTWGNGDITTINGNIELIEFTANCNEYTVIQGQSSSTTFSLSNDIYLSYVNMKDFNITGQGSLTVEGSDLGGCSNITFVNPPDQTYYWVGGSGNINDLNHWATTSGGTTFHSCLPTIKDNIMIDSNSGVNSGETIYINQLSVNCNDFTIAGTASPNITLEGEFNTPSNIYIYGNITFTPTTTTTYIGTFNNWYLNSESDINIHTHNIDLNRLIIEKTLGNINILSDLKVSDVCRLERGNLYTNQHNITGGVLAAGGGCNGPDCPEKDWYIDGSIFVVEKFNSGNNYGSLDIFGNHEIFTGEFESSPSMNYDKVTITDNELTFSNLYTNHLIPIGSSFRTLTIDNQYTTRIAGNMSITDTFTIINQSEIIFNASSFYSGEYVELLGEIITPEASACGDLTKLLVEFASTYKIKKPSGTLEINNVILDQIGTEGAAQFNANNSIVLGTNAQWNITPITGDDMYWIGGQGDWEDPTNWSLTSGGIANSNSCIPSGATNVFIDNNSFTAHNQEISLPLDTNLNCQSLTYSNTTWNGTSLAFPNNNIIGETALEIFQSLNITNPWTIDEGNNGLILLSGSDLSIDTDGTPLPKIEVHAGSGEFSMLSDLQCSYITLYSGTFKTNNFDLTSGSLQSEDNGGKHYEFGNSTITINGNLDLGYQYNDNVTYDASGANIICEDFDAASDTFNILELINPISMTSHSRTYHINQLILSGERVKVHNNAHFSIDNLVMNNENAILAIEDNGGVFLRESITSNISGSSLPLIESDNTYMVELLLDKNICIDGELEFENIEVTGGYKIHAPNATDNGGNMNIDFNTYTDNSTLYWIGGSGVFQHQSNWSNGSGACPTSIAPATASQLVFDNYSFRPDESTITFSSNVTIGDMLFTNSNIEADLVIPFRLKPNSITVDGGMVKQRDNNNSSLGPAIQLDEHLEVINGGSYTLEQSILHSARRPSDMTQAAIHVSADSKLHAPNSLILISGHPTGNTDPAVLLPSAADIDLSTTELKTFKPVGTGQPNNDMSFDLGGHTIEKFTMDNAFALAQQIKLISNCHLKSVQLENGVLRVADGVVVEVD